MRRLTFIIGLFLTFDVCAAITADDIGRAFIVGTRAYEAQDYEHAVQVFEEVLELQPDCARCAHLLGKSYGRMAEKAGWMSAVGLVKKTRSALEQAVELAPDDIDAVEDLIRFYRAAPGFLGGSAEKAERLEQRLRYATAERTG